MKKKMMEGMDVDKVSMKKKLLEELKAMMKMDDGEEFVKPKMAVKVAASSKEGLKEGLEQAEELISKADKIKEMRKKMLMSDEECPVCGLEECEC